MSCEQEFCTLWFFHAIFERVEEFNVFDLAPNFAISKPVRFFLINLYIIFFSWSIKQQVK